MLTDPQPFRYYNAGEAFIYRENRYAGASMSGWKDLSYGRRLPTAYRNVFIQDDPDAFAAICNATIATLCAGDLADAGNSLPRLASGGQ